MFRVARLFGVVASRSSARHVFQAADRATAEPARKSMWRFVLGGTVAVVAAAVTVDVIQSGFPVRAASVEEPEVVKSPAKSGWRSWFSFGGAQSGSDGVDVHIREGDIPVEEAVLTFAPDVPPPITRQHPVRLVVRMDSTVEVLNVSPRHKFPFWTFNGHVPGPFIRARVGDSLQVVYTNKDQTGIGHNIDFHAVSGPGGGAPCLYAEPGEKKVGTFKLLHPGLFVYHCAAGPVPVHIANGMYGLILVEPEQGLSKVDREYYVMQSEIYAEPPAAGSNVLEPSYSQGLLEHPMYVVLNGAEGALTEKPLLATQGDRVRIFFGNAGPNLISSFHTIGAIFDKVYREGDLISPPARSIQTTLVPAGGAAVVELDLPVPGSLTLVDHSIFRIEKGCVGFLKVAARGGDTRKDIYTSGEPPVQCPGCKLHN